MKSIHIIVFGTVQGVGFRHYTKEQAIALGILGTVTNLSNGNVEIYAMGKAQALKEFLVWCHNGPSTSHVVSIEYEYIENLNADSFEIIR